MRITITVTEGPHKKSVNVGDRASAETAIGFLTHWAEGIRTASTASDQKAAKPCT